jgi:KDO2-lipid IV(A) lauroyltransferase
MGRLKNPPLRNLSDRSQAAALRLAVAALQRLSPVAASDFGAWLSRAIGPRLPTTRIADANLRQAFPHLNAAERGKIIRAVWDNLGRNFAELPHLAAFKHTPSGPGWEIEGEEHIDALRAGGGKALFFSGHLGNWEMILPIAAALGFAVSGFYRAASNPQADRIIQDLRQKALGPNVSMFAKGQQGAKAALAYLKSGGSLGLLVDQKMNDGIAVPFFGRPAMTAPALARFALRYPMPIVPVRVVRLGPARFRMVCETPLDVPRTGNSVADTYAITLALNQKLENWIREDPGSWLWLHRRWPKPAA